VNRSTAEVLKAIADIGERLLETHGAEQATKCVVSTVLRLFDGRWRNFMTT
jgi:hypothetical protein